MNDENDANMQHWLEEPLVPRQLSFQRVKLDVIYMKDQINRDFRSKPMPNNIRKHRNISIILLIVQMVCAVAALAYYFRRKVSILPYRSIIKS